MIKMNLGLQMLANRLKTWLEDRRQAYTTSSSRMLDAATLSFNGKLGGEEEDESLEA